MSDQFRFDVRSADDSTRDGPVGDAATGGAPDPAHERDPWAPGGTMANAPIPPAPHFFDEPSETATGPSRPATTTPGPSRNSRVAIIAGVAAVVLAGALWIAGRDDPDAAPPSTQPVDSEPDEEPAEDDEPAPPTTQVRPPTEVLTGATEVVVPVPEPLPPGAVVGLPGMEVVVLAESGEVRLIDTVAATQTSLGDFRFPAGASMAATDDSVVVWSDDAAEEIIVLRRNQLPLVFESGVPVADVVAQHDGEYLLIAEDPSMTRELRIDSVVRTTEVDFAVGEPRDALAHPSGSLMVQTDDGVFRLGLGGPTLLSTGDVVAANERFVLYEECALGGGCRLVREDVELGERGDVAVNPAPLTATVSPRVLSPDGSALVEIGNVAQPFRVRIIDVATGETIDVLTEGELSSVAWAPDSASFFGIVDGVAVVVDRATGEVTELGTDGDRIASLVVRPVPEATAAVPGVESTILVRLTDLTGLDLVAYTRDGDVLAVDVDARTYRARPGFEFESGAPLDVLPGVGAVAVSSWDGSGGFLVNDEGDVVVLDALSPGGPLYPGPDAGTAWRFADDAAALTTSLELVDQTGERLGPRVDLEQLPAVVSDANGALLVDAPGGVYLADGTAVARVTSGSLVAVGPTTFYARECDEVLACAVVRIDRATGERTVPEVEGLANVPSLEQQTFGRAGAAVSPDGDVVLVQTAVNGLGWSMVDVAAGTVLGVPGPAINSPVVWSDDSRYAVYLSGERLRVFDRDAGALAELGQLPPVLAFAEAVEAPGGENAEGDGGGGGEVGAISQADRRATTR